jgi:cyclopropane fatty-acyl-phospholipid synthase-like methyltransferase
MSEKPFSQFCENNKHAILNQLQRHFSACKHVLEVGSGTGQHAVHFAEYLPHLHWHTCDQAHYHQGIQAWINDSQLSNISHPVCLTLPDDPLPSLEFDAVFTANTAHIMQKHAVQALMQNVAERLPQQGVFCQYGPFTEQGRFSSDSNAAFHDKLLREGYGGYRDITELLDWAPDLLLTKQVPMPANNLLLIWHKK